MDQNIQDLNFFSEDYSKMSKKGSSLFRKDRTEGLTDGIFATVMTI